jgi:hypothetical protein
MNWQSRLQTSWMVMGARWALDDAALHHSGHSLELSGATRADVWMGGPMPLARAVLERSRRSVPSSQENQRRPSGS